MTKKLTDLDSCTLEYANQWWWKARDLGKLLGFGSGGGNLSRMYALGKFGPPGKALRMWTRDSRGVVWLTSDGIARTLTTLALNYPKHQRAAQRLLKEYDRGEHRHARIAPEIEYALGAGMAVRATSKGIVAFVFLDEYDRRHIIPIADLDQDWHQVLTYQLSATEP